jgi:hypothetical protein
MTNHDRDDDALMRLITVFDVAADCFLQQATDQTILIGPLLWQPADDGDAYFDVFTKTGMTRLRLVQRDDTAPVALFAALKARRPLLTVHIFDDELELAFCREHLSPSAQATRCREAIAAERAGKEPPF